MSRHNSKNNKYTGKQTDLNTKGEKINKIEVKPVWASETMTAEGEKNERQKNEKGTRSTSRKTSKDGIYLQDTDKRN